MRLTVKITPSLRFPDFKGSWKRWLLDEFATRGSGHTPSKSFPEYYGGDIDWVSLADSNQLDNGYIEKTKSKITELGLRHSSAVLHSAGTVILSRDAGIGKSAVMKRSMAVSQHFIVWRPTEGISVDWFIYYWLQIMKPEFERIAIGSTIKTIGLPYFKKLEISAPDVPEQQKIAGFLTAVDERIAHLSQKKALLEIYKKGVVQQLFTQALRFQDDHGNDFPDWQEKTLGDVSSVITSGSRDWAQFYSETGSLFLRMTNLPRNGIYLLLDDLKFVSLPKDGHEGARTSLRPHDILISITAELGKIGWIPENLGPAFINQHTALVRPILKLVDSKFIAYGLAHPKANVRLNRLNDAGAKSALNLSTIREFTIPVPSLPEQTKIANFLTALDRKIEALAAQIAHTQTWKKGLLQQMFV